MAQVILTRLFRSELESSFHLSTSSTLTILRLLQGLLSTCSVFVLLQAFELLTWASISRNSGSRILHLLGLSPTTGILGTCSIGLSKHAKWVDRGSAILKLGLSTIIWVSGILLFANTNINTVYRSVSTYNVTAGVGPFQGSYVAEFINMLQTNNAPYNYTVLPYQLITTSSNLISNTMHTIDTTPSVCKDGKTCHGYLLTGGLLLTDPWGSTDFLDYPAVTIYNAPAMQIDFMRGIEQGDEFDDPLDCTDYGAENFLIAVKFCLARSQVRPGSLNASKSI